MEQKVLQTTMVKWLILAASLIFQNSSLACDLDELIKVNDVIQSANTSGSIQKTLSTCGDGKGSFYHEVNRRAKQLYISGNDSIVEKLKVSSLVSLYRLSADQKYLDEIKNRFLTTEHGAVEFCIRKYFSTKSNCSHEMLLPYINKGLPHAIWAGANFSSNNDHRLKMLESSAAQGHIDAQVEYILAVIDDVPDEYANQLKEILLRIVDKGDSIDGEIFVLKSFFLGYGPFKKDSELLLDYAKKFIEYRDLPEYYYFLAWGYLDAGDEDLFLLNMTIAAEKGYDEAKIVLDTAK
ncbi:hypothetical protein [Shewanella gaetbuli]|uniref:Sel1 repeat family protein n=1 Tax=Shewanella gaetbuli TaxID=220752 RepID=A0A9X1ZHK8_9GAMM|nr:hypothetical protein [Shewanella gaetbuli]MCL1142449.1 hypothetical protein [Shewanella gaetbuli]